MNFFYHKTGIGRKTFTIFLPGTRLNHRGMYGAAWIKDGPRMTGAFWKTGAAVIKGFFIFFKIWNIYESVVHVLSNLESMVSQQ